MTTRKLRNHAVGAMITASIGILLQAYMIFVEDEPGAVPLILILVGIAWYFMSRRRLT